MSTPWQSIADTLVSECPSPTYRRQTAEILSKVELLGPVTDASRSPSDEFRRVYRFLHYNEPTRILAVVDELLQRFGRGGTQPVSTRNAWNYVVGAFDRWIGRARVFYVAVGLLEGALRSRLDAKLTDVFGQYWPGHIDAVPSAVREQLDAGDARALIATVRRKLEERDSSATADESVALLEDIAALMATRASPAETGSDFVKRLTFGQLRSFFQTKRLWQSPVYIGSVFLDSETAQPPLRQAVDRAFEIIQETRNEVSHYRPTGRLSFELALFQAATLARWLGVDLQHIYGSVDTRLSTELSHLCNQPPGKSESCSSVGCVIPSPFDAMLATAPRTASELQSAITITACLYHRVQTRAIVHRPPATA
jgi:hypothetical protein